MTTPTTTGAAPASQPLFSKITRWVGLVVLGALHIVNKADQEFDTLEPELVNLLNEGGSILKYVPFANPEIVPFLNAGIALLGAAKASMDATVALEPEVLAQLASLKQNGYSFIAIEDDLKTDVESLLSNYKAEFKTATGAIATLQAAQDVPSSKITAEVATNVKAAISGEASASASGVAQRPTS